MSLKAEIKMLKAALAQTPSTTVAEEQDQEDDDDDDDDVPDLEEVPEVGNGSDALCSAM